MRRPAAQTGARAIRTSASSGSRGGTTPASLRHRTPCPPLVAPNLPERERAAVPPIYLGAVSLSHVDLPGRQIVSQRMFHADELAFRTGDRVSASGSLLHPGLDPKGVGLLGRAPGLIGQAGFGLLSRGPTGYRPNR